MNHRNKSMHNPNVTDLHHLKICIGVPEWQPMHQVMKGEPADATYVIQGNLAKGLVASGHHLTFVAPHSLDEIICTIDPLQPMFAPRVWTNNRMFALAGKGVWRAQKILGIPYLNVFFNLRFFDACLQCLPGHNLVYERNGLYNAGLAMACRRLRLPYVVFFEADQILELDIMGKPLTGLLRRRAQQLLHYNLETADCIICVSDQGKSHLVSHLGESPEKIVVFPNAVDVQRFSPDPQARVQIRTALGIADNPMVMFVGNFFHWHDVSTLFRAFAQLLTVRPDVRLVMVGDGENRTMAVQQVADLDISHAVQFTGLVPHTQVPHYVAAADVAVVPYPPMRQELWLSPLKLFEYMASGTAIVASRIGQVAQVLTHERNGLLVTPGDAIEMANALVRLIDNAELRSSLGKQAREDAVRKHSWEQYISRLERLFTAVIAKQPVNQI